MFIVGLIILALSIVFIIAGGAAKKRGISEQPRSGWSERSG